MSLKHNKKRNPGLLAEFFSRYIAECGITKKYSNITKAKNIWDKYFKIGTELQKEYSLFAALNESQFTNKEVAINLLQDVKRVARKEIDSKKLEKEKTRLTREINDTLPERNFFDKNIDNYTNYATIQILLDSWTNNKPLREGVINPALTELEDQVLEFMCNNKKNKEIINENTSNTKQDEFFEYTDEDINGMVVKIMTNKMNEKFSESLTSGQKKILQEFVFGNDMKKLSFTLSSLKEETLNLVDKTLEKKETGLSKTQRDNIEEIKGLLEGEYKDTSVINDNNIVFYMSVSKLNEELKED